MSSGAPTGIKLVLLGNTCVGKTCLVRYATTGLFDSNSNPTLAASFSSKTLTIRNKDINLQIWDTAGQEVFRSLAGFYARGARGAIIVFDLTNKSSFTDVPKWIDFIFEQSPGAKIVVFGNKSDLKAERAVTSEEINRMADKIHAKIIEGSAKTGENVEESFEEMALMVMDQEIPKTKPIDLKEPDKKNEGEGNCCQ